MLLIMVLSSIHIRVMLECESILSIGNYLIMMYSFSFQAIW